MEIGRRAEPTRADSKNVLSVDLLRLFVLLYTMLHLYYYIHGRIMYIYRYANTYRDMHTIVIDNEIWNIHSKPVEQHIDFFEILGSF